MTAINSTYKSLTIQEAIKFASEMETKTRAGLIKIISEEMYYKLCRLGIITEGATIDGNNNRIAVWKLTNRANLFNRLENPKHSTDRLNVAKSLTNIGY